MSYVMIDNAEKLNAFCQKLVKNDWVALDTEFLRVDTYYPKLCLIQIHSQDGQTALIDPLAFEQPKTDLQPFWQCLTNPDLVKIFHSARQDIEVLYQLSGQMPVSIFDTQIAGIFLGYGNLSGLAKMVLGELHKTLEKDQTRTDWSVRPLTDKQLQYALDDVRYLAPLYEKVIAQLSTKQLNALNEDFSALLKAELYQTLPSKAGQKIKSTKGLSPKQLAIVYALAEWREAFAIENNQPRKWLLSDDVIINIAKRPPKVKEALYKVPTIKASTIKTHGNQLIELIDEVFAHPDSWPEKPKAQPKATSDEVKLLDIMQACLTQTSQDFNCPANHFANKNDLLSILRKPEPVLIGWRFLLLEQPFRELLTGQKSLKIERNTITIN